ncbi:MAG: hypothetical protein ACHP7P_15160 [Terriglobales bacterium]
MALHEQSVGATDEWYTPAHVFEAMGVQFDSDPAPAPLALTPASSWTVQRRVWQGFVWLNPPFGGRNGIVPWLERFFAHGNGVALVPDRTSAPWWQAFAPRADLVLFVSPKLKFIGADGQPGASPAQGTCLLAVGERGCEALRNAARARLGSLFEPCI